MYSPAKSARIGSTCSAMCPLGTLCCICSGTNDSGRHWRGNGTWFWHAFKWNAERTDPYFPFHELGYRRYARQRNRNPFVRKFPAQKKTEPDNWNGENFQLSVFHSFALNLCWLFLALAFDFSRSVSVFHLFHNRSQSRLWALISASRRGWEVGKLESAINFVSPALSKSGFLCLCKRYSHFVCIERKWTSIKCTWNEVSAFLLGFTAKTIKKCMCQRRSRLEWVKTSKVIEHFQFKLNSTKIIILVHKKTFDRLFLAFLISIVKIQHPHFYFVPLNLHLLSFRERSIE